MYKIGVASNKKLIELFNMMKSGSLILKPYFQRKLVWNNKHKENFIDTILRGLPFPEIYLADGEIDLDSQKSKTLVVDGQQRMSTIYQYVTESKDFIIKNVKTFSQLSSKQKTDFFDYIIVIRDLGRIDDEKIIDIFQRINSVQYALNSMEIQNALYQGEFITTAKQILENRDFYSQVDIFSETEYSRMKDMEFVLLIMSTIEEKGYFSGSKGIECYVKQFDPEYTDKDLMIGDFNSVLKLIIDCGLQPDSIWLRKTNMFTLIVELIKFKRQNGFLPKKGDLKRTLITFENSLYENKLANIEKNEFAAYYYYIFQGTSSRKGRLIRGNLLRKYLNLLK
jgi:hypothetical protein